MHTVSRLIDQFAPEHYQLSLTLRRAERTFGGIVTINGTTTNDTQRIIVHAKNLTLLSATVDGKAAHYTAALNDEIVITHPDIHPGRHSITIEFSGTITDPMHGIYPCYYTYGGVKKELLATQFESHHAREAFPCIDEPEAKATFDVTLTTEQDITVLGNMPIHRQTIDGEQLVTTFETTPRMSTYLLAWVAGELHRKTSLTKQGVEVNIWATPAQPPESLDFALDIATRTIDFFNEYFDTPYPLPKSDHVALPDFSAGAMENWGLVTYREITLLANPRTASVSAKHYIAAVIAHEISHQWFGNLVTMKWWNNLWLNESFANLMEYVAPDALHPEWNVWLDFATTETIMALRRDSLDGVQSVQTTVNHPDEISTLFDSAIVYAKGGQLLRMLQRYIGHDAFQAGLKAYFATHKYQNTDEHDLWNALSTASGKSIDSFMNAWITQSGYPVVHVRSHNDTLTLSQEQFFVGPHKPSTKLWPIPLGASDNSLPDILTAKTITIPYHQTSPLRLNVGATAHFITHYDAPLLAKLIETVRLGQASQLDRLQLLNEQMLLARGGSIASDSLIGLLDAYKNETSEAVWELISLTISELRKFVETDPRAHKALRAFAVRLARTQYQQLGWNPHANEPESNTKLRATIIGLMVYGEDPDTSAHAQSLYYSQHMRTLEPDLRPLIIAATVRDTNDPAIIDTLLDLYHTTTSPDLRQDIMRGLAATRTAAHISRFLQLIITGSIRQQDVAHWFALLIRNPHARPIAWQWLRENWQWIETTFHSDKSYDAFPRYASVSLTTPEQLQEYHDFFTPLLKEPALTRTIRIGLAEIQGNIALIEKDGAAVRKTLIEL